MKKQTSTALLAVSLGLTLALALVTGLSLLAGAVEAAPASQSNGFITVTVKLGDNLGRYARLYGASGRALVNANPQIKDPNLIYPGDTITIPVVRTSTPSLTTPFFYTVVSGDTLSSIGAKFEMNPNVIANANGITDGAVVVGKTYLIPAGPHEHIAREGETIKSIAAFYGVSVQFVLNSNNLPNPDLIFAGQPIYIATIYDARPVPLTGSGAIVPTNTPKPGPTATATLPPGVTPTKTPTPTGIPPVSGNFIQVTVRSGESLVTYTYRYGVTGGRIRLANPQLLDPNLLFPGTVVTIPVPVSFTPSRTTPFFYGVASGDTITSIATKFEMENDVLAEHNSGAAFAVGTTILVPAGPHVYIVKTGDDLKGIAAKYGTTADFLLTGNNLPNPDRIFPGQEIFIPIQYDAAPKGYD
jgi:LysM repeat protein